VLVFGAAEDHSAWQAERSVQTQCSRRFAQRITAADPLDRTLLCAQVTNERRKQLQPRRVDAIDRGTVNLHVAALVEAFSQLGLQGVDCPNGWRGQNDRTRIFHE
jgi:hypothetical protein